MGEWIIGIVIKECIRTTIGIHSSIPSSAPGSCIGMLHVQQRCWGLSARILWHSLTGLSSETTGDTASKCAKQRPDKNRSENKTVKVP